MTVREWQDLISDPLRPLANKAIGGEYAPGSTFKMMVALAALKRGIDPNRHVFCPGIFSVGNTNFHCWKKGGHGSVDMYNALKLLLRRLLLRHGDADGHRQHRGDGARSSASAPRPASTLPGERRGLIPDSTWKKATYGEPWHPGETLFAGIGQGFITATPLQLAVMAARIGDAAAPSCRISAAAAIVGADRGAGARAGRRWIFPNGTSRSCARACGG